MQYFILIGIAFILLVFTFVRAKVSHFDCANCGFRFKVTPITYIFKMHMGLSRLAKCPNCGNESGMSLVMDRKLKASYITVNMRNEK